MQRRNAATSPKAAQGLARQPSGEDGTVLLVAIDANALDRKTPARAAAVEAFEDLSRAGRFALFVGEGVRREMGQAAVDSGTDRRFVRPPSAAEHVARIRVRAIVQGNAKPGKHEADAAHLSAAAEAGCGYFLTYDGRLLQRRGDLEGFALPPGMRVATIEEFLADLAAEER